MKNLRANWDVLDERFAWIRAMRDCPQDAVFHAEGGLWTHVRMVSEAMTAHAEFRGRSEAERDILLAAALLHDVAKPACTRQENGRITSRGHSARGAIDARRILWEMGAPFAAREQVCALIRHHQSPFHWMEREDPRRLVYRISQSARCDLLALLAEADARGRICADQERILLNVELFREFCREQGCLDKPRKFASAHSRFQYFRTEGRDPDYEAHDDTRSTAVLMSGLPGSGKDTWIREHAAGLPAVSLDDIRREIGAASTGDQGRVLQAARDKARGHLRAARDFVWNATNLSREMRAPLIELFASYKARVRIVYVEASAEALFARNRSRTAVVPEAAIERMMSRWEVPDATEAHAVEWRLL